MGQMLPSMCLLAVHHELMSQTAPVTDRWVGKPSGIGTRTWRGRRSNPTLCCACGRPRFYSKSWPRTWRLSMARFYDSAAWEQVAGGLLARWLESVRPFTDVDAKRLIDYPAPKVQLVASLPVTALLSLAARTGQQARPVPNGAPGLGIPTYQLQVAGRTHAHPRTCSVVLQSWNRDNSRGATARRRCASSSMCPSMWLAAVIQLGVT